MRDKKSNPKRAERDKKRIIQREQRDSERGRQIDIEIKRGRWIDIEIKTGVGRVRINCVTWLQSFCS